MSVTWNSRYNNIINNLNKLLTYLIFILFLTLPFRRIISITGSLTISVVSGTIIIIVWIIKVIFSYKIRRPATMHIFLGAFVTWVSVSVLWSVDRYQTIIEMFEYFSLSLISLACWDVGRKKSIIRFWSQGYVYAQFFVITAILFDSITRQSTRATAFGQNPNIVAMEVVIGIPLALILLHSVRKRAYSIKSILNLSFPAFAIVAVSFTGSRQAILATFLCFIPYISVYLYKGGKYERIKLVFLATCILLTAMYLIPGETLDRLLSLIQPIVNTDGKSILDQLPLGTRIERYTMGIELLKQNILTGVGAGGYPQAIVQSFGYSRTSSDSTIISILSEVGVVGFSIYSLMTLSTLKAVGSLPMKFSSLLIGMFLILTIMLLADNYGTSFVVYFVMMILVTYSQNPT